MHALLFLLHTAPRTLKMAGDVIYCFCLFYYILQKHICTKLDFRLTFIWKTSIGTIWTPRTIWAWLWV